MNGSLDPSQLTDVMHILVRLRLVPDLLRAGLRADALSVTMQELWLGEAVTAGLVDDARALLQAGFEASPETLQDIRLRAIRSDSWKAISATFGAGQDARRAPLSKGGGVHSLFRTFSPRLQAILAALPDSSYVRPK
jgi:hypothetical protein